MNQDNFTLRHIGVESSDIDQMIQSIGVKSVDELIGQVVPSKIRLKERADIIGKAISESDLLPYMKLLGDKNIEYRSFIGLGYYVSIIPPVILHNVLENPEWYSFNDINSIETSQGRLELLFYFQKMVCSLTGMTSCNCTSNDEASAASEAMIMMYESRANRESNILFVDENVYPQTLDMLLTYSEPLGIDIICENYSEYQLSGCEFGAILQYPAANGDVRYYEEFTQQTHDVGCAVCCIADLMSLSLLQSPESWGADIVVGSTQRLGLPLGLGGANAGFVASNSKLQSSIPGCIVVECEDRIGQKAFRIDSHKGAKVSPSIMAMVSTLYVMYHGADGLRSIAQHIHNCAYTVAKSLTSFGYTLTSNNIFDTIEVECESAVVNQMALERGFNLFYPNDSRVRISFDEQTTFTELESIVDLFATVAGKRVPKSFKLRVDKVAYQREDSILSDDVFTQYHTELELMRYINRLVSKEQSSNNSMLSQASKNLIYTRDIMPLKSIHPFAPQSQMEGYIDLVTYLEEGLSSLMGMRSTTLQPITEDSAEYTSLMMMRAYHQSRGQGYRDIIIIPEAIYDSKLNSALMVGMRAEPIACDTYGNIDINDLNGKVELYSNELSGIMLCYPYSHGVFDSRIRSIIDIVHDFGGQVYIDGEGAESYLGLTNPGYIGADVCTLPLRTLSMPIGGCAVGVAPHLSPFLPSHSIVSTGGDEGITAVSATPYGNAIFLPMVYSYLKVMGGLGLRKSTEIAIVNANYLSSRLSLDYITYYTDEKGRVAHKFLLDLQNFPVEYQVSVDDVARRLIDYGFCKPKIEHNLLLVESTECESKMVLDRFIGALISIKRECEDGLGGVVTDAPHVVLEAINSDWNYEYSRQVALYPSEWRGEFRYFPEVSRLK